jgi:general secretion pathway protein C
MQRLPVVTSFVLFLALCASLTYWLVEWMTPPPRPVAAPPQASRELPPVVAAANLFGGRASNAGMANVQLKGILRAGSRGDSMAIIAVDGKPARALRADAEVASGLTVKSIHARSVVLSDRGAERELTLPAFAAQEGAMASLPGRSPEPPAPQATAPSSLPAQLPPSSTAQSTVPPQTAGPSAGATSAAGSGAGPGAANAQSPIVGQRPAGIGPQTEPPLMTAPQR